MKFLFAPFEDFVSQYTTAQSRKRYDDNEVLELQIYETSILAIVQGSSIYKVQIDYNTDKVKKALCSCPYDSEGFCKHIIHVLVQADSSVALGRVETDFVQTDLFGEKIISSVPERINELIWIKNQKVLSITPAYLKKNALKIRHNSNHITTPLTHIEEGILEVAVYTSYFSGNYELVSIQQMQDDILLSCSCVNQGNLLCEHQHIVFDKIRTIELFRLPFQKDAILQLFRNKAKEFGMESLSKEELYSYFSTEVNYGKLIIQPKINLFSFSNASKKQIDKIIPSFQFPEKDNNSETFVVLETTDYGEYGFSLMKAPLAKSGKIKSPVSEVSLSHALTTTKDPAELLFYGGLMNQELYQDDSEDFFHFKNILKNPLQLPFYHFENANLYKPTPKNLKPLQIHIEKPEITIKVKEKDLITVTCHLKIGGKTISSAKLKVMDAFVLQGDHLYFVDHPAILNLIEFFRKHKNKIFLHAKGFDEFKTNFLDKIEDFAQIDYAFIKKAPAKILKQNTMDKVSDRLIYLSENGDWILITPMVRYGEIEVPVLSKRTIYTEMADGTRYSIKRDDDEELKFLRNIQKQHSEFEETPAMDFFYLHKQEFLDEGWFLDAFEEWRKNEYDILGFSQLKNNNLNPNKMSVSIAVNSGIDWFDVHAKISYGTQEVKLKDLQKSVLNKKRYIKLSDGSQGILPEEWIEKFSKYFRSGEIKGETIRTHKSNFQLIDELFEKEVLSKEVKMELDQFREKIKDFQSIAEVKLPKKLKAELRPYQKEGLNWLNFLDEFGFGGILADDMGLGKTIQIITYILAQQEKGKKLPNLIVVPTSLLFNWQKELEKFAPSLRYELWYGANRKVENLSLKKTDILLTTYGTMLSDIEFLKEQIFQLIVLDESQAIKNPNSKRYKAAKLLQGKQKLALTGTPVENNTFDLFAQLSFVMPGLLGSQKRFKDNYSTPIDKFQDDKRARELQQKVHPFILRRTKKQVATELPDKTNMTIYCEMNHAQRKIYDAYKQEFQLYLQGKSEEDLNSSQLHILQGLTKLRQICNSPALLGDEEYYGSDSAKLDELMVQIDKLKQDHKVLIFSQFVGMLELIREQLEQQKIGYSYLTGQTRNREKAVEEFQQNEDVRVFLISLKAGGTGLNLTEAEYVFIIDPWWNPAAENQAIDRAYRIGQKNHVIAIRLITPNSIEEKIMELQDRKLQLVEDLIHTDKNTFKNLSKDDLMNLV